MGALLNYFFFFIFHLWKGFFTWKLWFRLQVMGLALWDIILTSHKIVIAFHPQMMMRWNMKCLQTWIYKNNCFCNYNLCFQLISHVQCQWIGIGHWPINGLKHGSLRCVHYYVSNAKVVQNFNQLHFSWIWQIYVTLDAHHCAPCIIYKLHHIQVLN